MLGGQTTMYQLKCRGSTNLCQGLKDFFDCLFLLAQFRKMSIHDSLFLQAQCFSSLCAATTRATQ
jgi:hypothetical protein